MREEVGMEVVPCLSDKVEEEKGREHSKVEVGTCVEAMPICERGREGDENCVFVTHTHTQNQGKVLACPVLNVGHFFKSLVLACVDLTSSLGIILYTML